MRLYLVRHGKTDAHLEKKRQTPQTPLGNFGMNQAKSLAKTLVALNADVLLSSDWPRALQTAEIISREINLPVKKYPDLHELENSKLVHGVPDESEINLQFLKERSLSAEELNFDWKFRGEGESLNEVLVRARRVCNDLATEYPKKRVIAVTHGTFLAAMIIEMKFGVNPDKKTVIDFLAKLKFHNAGISEVEYNEDSGKWIIVSIDNHSHLI